MGDKHQFYVPSHLQPSFDADPFAASSSAFLDDTSFEYNLNIDDDAADLYPERDMNYAKKMMAFETTIQEKMKEELREEEILFVQKWTNMGLQIVALVTDHLVSHPFIVLRRQCQVNNKLSRFHLVPVTLIPIVINIHRWQGLTCLWKGVGSVLVIKGLTLAVQDLISKITFWPKEISLDSSGKYIGKHIMLKCVTYAIITPFYSASLVETVQSEIASEKPEFLDVFKEGLRRLLSFGVPQKGRMLPVWGLIVPTAMYFILKHFFTLVMQTTLSRILIANQETQHRKQGAIPKDFQIKDAKNIEFTSSLVAGLSADIVLYPLETILHRLHLQGTRTIIDNLDDGLSVTPILTNFESVIDCYESTIREEGAAGLYKGFGTLVLQCLAYTSIIKLSKFVFTQISILFCKNDANSYMNAGGETVHRGKHSMPMPKSQQAELKIRRPKKKLSFTPTCAPVDYDLSSDSEDRSDYDNLRGRF